jgi:hypothetical protein
VEKKGRYWKDEQNILQKCLMKKKRIKRTIKGTS